MVFYFDEGRSRPPLPILTNVEIKVVIFLRLTLATIKLLTRRRRYKCQIIDVKNEEL